MSSTEADPGSRPTVNRRPPARNRRLFRDAVMLATTSSAKTGQDSESPLALTSRALAMPSMLDTRNLAVIGSLSAGPPTAVGIGVIVGAADTVGLLVGAAETVGIGEMVGMGEMVGIPRSPSPLLPEPEPGGLLVGAGEIEGAMDGALELDGAAEDVGAAEGALDTEGAAEMVGAAEGASVAGQE